MYPYSLVLTPEEFRALQWMEDRGYTGGLVKHADSVGEAEGLITLYYREASAWAVAQEAEEDRFAFGTCASTPLLRKMWDFLGKIV